MLLFSLSAKILTYMQIDNIGVLLFLTPFGYNRMLFALLSILEYQLVSRYRQLPIVTFTLNLPVYKSETLFRSMLTILLARILPHLSLNSRYVLK